MKYRLASVGPSCRATEYVVQQFIHVFIHRKRAVTYWNGFVLEHLNIYIKEKDTWGTKNLFMNEIYWANASDNLLTEVSP
jgi:hypothetical protein